MTKTNDQILLDAILAEQRATWGAALRDDRLFELFSAEQLLKDKDLTTADIETGNIGQSLDGQIDSFYLFADGSDPIFLISTFAITKDLLKSMTI
jgi:hypothetical protein